MEKATKKVIVARKHAVERIKAKFNTEWIELLDFTVDDKNYIVTPKTYLGSNRFYELSAHVHRLGGFYVSAGKQSHFKIPK